MNFWSAEVARHGANGKTGLWLAIMALVFFCGIVLKTWLFGR